MTQYLLAVHGTEESPYTSEEQMQQAFAAVDAFNQDLMASGQWVFGGGLLSASSARVVDATGSEVLTTDGPYLEAKEHLGGFWVIDVPDLDAALEVARRGSLACLNPVEVRPFQAV